MSTSIRVNDDLVQRAKKKGALLQRSPPEQIEHWARLGSIMEDVLSCPAQASLKASATRDDLDRALSLADTPEGTRRAQAVIARTSQAIVSND